MSQKNIKSWHNERIEALYDFEVKCDKEFDSFGLQRFEINALKSIK